MLSIVPTPIGHLRDITLRALDVLKAADLIVCEDTRRTKILLEHYQVVRADGSAPALESFHEHSSRERLDGILKRVAEGASVAVVSDGGMPAISDPGFEFVHAAILRKLPVEVLPGASALTTALVVSGLAVDEFSFFGFLPAKSAARKKRLTGLADREETLIFYESPYRLLKALQEMAETLGDREACVARELTKKFEEVARGNLSGLSAQFSKKKILGEIVILVSGKDRKKVFES